MMKIDENSKSRLISSLGDEWEYFEGEVPEGASDRVEIMLLGVSANWASMLPSLKNLRMIQTFSAGVDFFDFSPVPANVIICSNAGAFAGPIAEFVLGATIALARNFRKHDEDLREGKFIRDTSELYLRSKTIGILGTGGIGHATAKLAKSFGMRTLGMNTSGNKVDGFDQVFRREDMDFLLRQSDVVVVAVPLTNKTRDLLGQHEFEIVKPNCIIVNVARGAIINEEALYEFLKTHPGAKAALDVWWIYPKQGDQTFAQDYPISSLPNVLSYPHHSDGVDEQLRLGSNSVVDNIIRFVKKNEPLKGVVNREDYLGTKS
jgi:phosphoglycerate dehydrogenase-like enzyme